MSPKFGLALLLLCFVLLGLSEAQWQRQNQHQVRYRKNGRNMGDGFGGANGSPPPLDNSGIDCNQNTLAGGGRDRFIKPQPRN